MRWDEARVHLPLEARGEVKTLSDTIAFKLLERLRNIRETYLDEVLRGQDELVVPDGGRHTPNDGLIKRALCVRTYVYACVVGGQG